MSQVKHSCILVLVLPFLAIGGRSTHKFEGGGEGAVATANSDEERCDRVIKAVLGSGCMTRPDQPALVAVARACKDDPSFIDRWAFELTRSLLHCAAPTKDVGVDSSEETCDTKITQFVASCETVSDKELLVAVAQHCIPNDGALRPRAEEIQRKEVQCALTCDTAVETFRVGCETMMKDNSLEVLGQACKQYPPVLMSYSLTITKEMLSCAAEGDSGVDSSEETCNTRITQFVASCETVSDKELLVAVAQHCIPHDSTLRLRVDEIPRKVVQCALDRSRVAGKDQSA
jgi:bacterioferritin-associated ferredoxin